MNTPEWLKPGIYGAVIGRCLCRHRRIFLGWLGDRRHFE